MYQVPNYTQSVSMRLSEVLADIGVDERIVLKRRRTWLLNESLTHVNTQLLLNNTLTVYYFGSQSEGTTTLGMESDTDTLYRCNDFRVIQDWSEWIPDELNYLMFQDNSVSPGYCLLQLLRPDAPLPADREPNQYYFRDRTGKVLLKQSIMSGEYFDKLSLHGPARVRQGSPGYCDMDGVLAFHCKTWPQQARQWLDQLGEGQWPSAEMKQYCSRTGCFVVPVGCRASEHEQLEWRISTSLAERCLMLNLNITQIRCYVLMKMILKSSIIKPQYKDMISSYICKTVLFHCIANSHLNIWRENNLLSCLSLCLYLLFNIIRIENCPHFIIPENNLIRGKISPVDKVYIMEILNSIINSEGVALLDIKCDDLGFRFHLKFYNLFPVKTSACVSGVLFYNMATLCTGASLIRSLFLKNKGPSKVVQTLTNRLSKISRVHFDGLYKIACQLLAPRYCTILGFVLASININQHNTVSADALKLITLGLNTDVASIKLKLASILIRVQEVQKAGLVLSEIERSYDLNIVEPVCGCYSFERKSFKQGFFTICDNHNEDVLQYATASCVIFLPCEIHCVPTELRYEMFRSTPGDNIFLTEEDDWMDNAVMDSLPYLYFLQYKVNSHRGRNNENEKKSALSKLIRTIITEPNIGHKETALNILGKCMEQEGRARDALQYYLMSYKVRRRNNAAKIHICTLVCILVNTQASNIHPKDGNSISINCDGRVTYKSEKIKVLLNIILHICKIFLFENI